MKKLVLTNIFSLIIGVVVAIKFGCNYYVSSEASTIAAIYSGELRAIPAKLTLSEEKRKCVEIELAEMMKSDINEKIKIMKNTNYFGTHDWQISSSLDAIKIYDNYINKKTKPICKNT